MSQDRQPSALAQAIGAVVSDTVNDRIEEYERRYHLGHTLRAGEIVAVLRADANLRMELAALLDAAERQ